MHRACIPQTCSHSVNVMNIVDSHVTLVVTIDPGRESFTGDSPGVCILNYFELHYIVSHEAKDRGIW